MPQFNSETKLRVIWQEAARRLGGVDALDLARELVERLNCSACGKSEDVFQPAEKVREDRLRCAGCGAECAAIFLHSIPEKSRCLEMTARTIGLPAWDILWARRGGDAVGFELTGDSPFKDKQA
jgi:hypothetical protein